MSSLREGWRWATIGETGEYINGVAFKPTDWGAEGLPIIRIQNLTDPGKAFNRTTRLVDPTYFVETGALLVSWSASLDAFLWDRETAVLNQHIFKVIPNEKVADKRFLYYLLKQAILEMLKSEHLHGSTMKHINRGPFLAHKVLLPPIGIQHSIVAEIEKQFTRLDAGVAALKRAQANLKRYRAAVLKAACEGKLVPTEAELARAEGRSYESGAALLERILAERRARWSGRGAYREPAAPKVAGLPELPEGWCWATVEQLASPAANSITDGPFGSNLKTEHYTEEGPRVIRLQNIKDGFFADEYAHISAERYSQLKKHHVMAGDIVIAGLGENPPRSCIIPSFVGPAIVKADCIRFRPHDNLSSRFLNSTLNAEPTRQRMKSIVHGVGRPRLNLDEIRSIVLPVPPNAEQERGAIEVERRLSVIDALDATVSANLQRAARLRQAILQRAFSGEL